MNTSIEKSDSAVGMSWIRYLALIVSLYSLSLTLIGYGYDMGYLGEFGLSPELVQRTAWDFLIRSYMPLLDIFIKITNALNFERSIDFVCTWLSTPIIWFSLLSLAMLVPVIAFLPNRRESALWKLAGVLVDMPWFCRIRKSAITAVRWTKSRFEERRNRLRLLGYFGWLVPPLGAAFLAWLMYWVFVGAMTLALFGTIFGPMLGFYSGKRDADVRVKQAHSCLASTAKQQPCVVLTRGGCELASGRLIDIGANRIYLFPFEKNGRFLSVPLERNTVSMFVGEEPAKIATAKSCPSQNS